MSGESPSDAFDESQVVAYLKAHKDFFVTHEALLADITVPHVTGTAVSLVERQVGVLRERNLELRERLERLLGVARENDMLFEKMRGLILGLIESASIADLAFALERELKARFASEFVSFLLFDVSGATGAALHPPSNPSLNPARWCRCITVVRSAFWPSVPPAPSISRLPWIRCLSVLSGMCWRACCCLS